LLEHDTAGDPMTGLRWSRRTTTRISEELHQLGICVCPNTVARLLDQMGYSLRVNHKQISTNSSPDRDRRNYPCGHKSSSEQVASLQLHPHEILPQWNYTIKPQL
jgi:Rhodopirellula transposase DDE domain